MIDTNKLYSSPILIVDDDNFICRVIRQILGELGFKNVFDHASVKNAVSFMNKNPIDLIVSDIQMPGTNGLEFLKQIRTGQLPARKDTRVIVLTSFSNTVVLRTAIRLDVNGFMVKPTKPATLLEKVKIALSEHLSLRNIGEYLNVNTDLDEIEAVAESRRGLHLGPASSRSRTDIDMTQENGAVPDLSVLPPNAIAVSVIDLKPGWALARDLRTKDGLLLLSTHQVLTRLIINRAIDLQNVLEYEQVWVFSEEPAKSSSSSS